MMQNGPVFVCLTQLKSLISIEAGADEEAEQGVKPDTIVVPEAVKELQRYLLRLGFNTWIKQKKNFLSIKKKSSK